MTERQHPLVIIHTSDIHSAFEALPGIAGIMSEIRREHPDARVLTADCGDHLDRMSLITEGSGGEVHVRLLEALRYDAVTLGNNEGLTLPKERLEALFGLGTSFGITCSNLRDRATGERPAWLKGHLLTERNGVKVAFIGATARYPIFYNLLGWEVEDPLSAIEAELRLIRDQADVVVLLSHLGLSTDKRIAESLPGIDVILGGHTHHVLEAPLRHGGSYLFGVGSLGRYVGEVRLYTDPRTRKLQKVEGRLHPVQEAPEDPVIRNMLNALSASSREVMDRPVARLEEPLPVDWERDSPLGNLLAAGLRKWTGAEIGLINSGQLLQSLLPGDVTKGMLLELCPSPVNPCTVIYKGSTLLKALGESLEEEYVNKPIYGNGFRGKRLGGLCLDGMEVLWGTDSDGRPLLREVRVGGKLLEPEGEYRVGTADMFTFGTGYLSLKEGDGVRYMLPEFLRDILEQELNDPSALVECRRPRYKCL